MKDPRANFRPPASKPSSAASNVAALRRKRSVTSASSALWFRTKTGPEPLRAPGALTSPLTRSMGVSSTLASATRNASTPNSSPKVHPVSS